MTGCDPADLTVVRAHVDETEVSKNRERRFGQLFEGSGEIDRTRQDPSGVSQERGHVRHSALFIQEMDSVDRDRHPFGQHLQELRIILTKVRQHLAAGVHHADDSTSGENRYRHDRSQPLILEGC